MAKRFDTARLFEPWRRTSAGYRSDETEFDAVRTRKKGMSFFSVTLAQTKRPGFMDWLQLAFDRELVVALHRSDNTTSKRGHQPLDIFVSRAEELWRIPAWVALRETAFVDGRWSNAAENLSSYLLGYTKAERKRWIATVRESFAAWSSVTAFVLLTRAQRAVVESVGRRCFGPVESLDDLVLFVRPDVVRRDAFSRVPKGTTLARVGVRGAEFLELFPRERRPSASRERTLDRESATILNRGLVSNVQLLTRSGWR